ncbi:uroporphyrinogen-III synthase [Parasutterella excrementihominis CAG:233]|nr:uroporphyrinogen-III synthase [Parasutterella excrementihominis CAG:233]
MRTILNMKPGPGGQRLQEELGAKTAGSGFGSKNGRFGLLAGVYV